MSDTSKPCGTNELRALEPKNVPPEVMRNWLNAQLTTAQRQVGYFTQKGRNLASTHPEPRLLACLSQRFVGKSSRSEEVAHGVWYALS